MALRNVHLHILLVFACFIVINTGRYSTSQLLQDNRFTHTHVLPTSDYLTYPKLAMHSKKYLVVLFEVMLTQRLRGGRKNMRPDSGSQVRRRKRKQAFRKTKHEQEKISKKEVVKPVQKDGVGLVHPSRLKSSDVEVPISELRQRYKSKVLPQDRKEIAKTIGHYPGKRNFLPKYQRRQLKKLAVKKPYVPPAVPIVDTPILSNSSVTDTRSKRGSNHVADSSAEIDSEELSDLLGTVDPELMITKGSDGFADNNTFSGLASITRDR
jgi:hypothetical protein